jgi:hypothetical protein
MIQMVVVEAYSYEVNSELKPSRKDKNPALI